MKIKLLVWALLSFGVLSHAQQSYKPTRTVVELPEKYLQFELTTGANFDLMYRGSDRKYDLLSTKPSTVPAVGMKLTHYFARKWGWYTQLQFNFYNSKRAKGIGSYTAGEFVEDLAKALLAPAFLTRPSIDAGVVYRIETVRWRLHPQVGFGWLSYLEPRSMEKRKTVNQEEISIKYKQSANPMVANVGLSLNYFFSDRLYLLLNANFQQPLQKSWAEMTYFTNDIESKKVKQQSITAGRNINFHAGVGFCPWIKSKR